MAAITFKLNKEYNEQHMGHGTISKKLKDYKQDELVELAVLALSSRNPILLRCFEEGSLPTLKDLLSAKAEIEEKLIEQTTVQTSAKPVIATPSTTPGGTASN